MDPDGLRAFAQRDRRVLPALKQAHWARRFREHGPEETFRVGQALREYARRVRPDWPTARDRAQDLAHHVELKGLLDRVPRALTGR
jgi:hypothetical protein